MAPNLYVAIHTLVTPSQWLPKHRKHAQRSESIIVPGQSLARTEHWKSPVPGVYRYTLAGGWYLIQLDSDPSLPETPDRVLYCGPLNRSILESQYQARSIKAQLPAAATPGSSRSTSPTRKKAKTSLSSSRRNSEQIQQQQPPPEVSFVRHDDGVSWINDRDAQGNLTKGPWQRFCLDKNTGKMRVMLKGDDPAYRRHTEESSRPASLTSGDSRSVASSIKAALPELDGKPPQTPSFLGPRSLSPRQSTDMSRPSSIRLLPDRSAGKSPLASPALSLE